MWRKTVCWWLLLFSVVQNKKRKEKNISCCFWTLYSILFIAHVLHFFPSFPYWWSLTLPWFSSITLQRISLYKSPWASAWKLSQDNSLRSRIAESRVSAYSNTLTATRLHRGMSSHIHQQPMMAPNLTHLYIIWLSTSWQFAGGKWYLIAVWICILWLLLRLRICYILDRDSAVFTTQFPFSRHMGRRHFTAPITIRLCSHEWVLTIWMWVGVWLIVTFAIFWKILKLVIAIILTLPFPLPTLHNCGAGGQWRSILILDLRNVAFSNITSWPRGWEIQRYNNIPTWFSCFTKFQQNLTHDLDGKIYYMGRLLPA